MIEIVLLLAFGASATAGLKVVIDWRKMSKRGPELPPVLRKLKAPGAIQPVIDAERQLAIEIGRRELETGKPEAWDNAFHATLEISGGRRENVIQGEIIQEYSHNGRELVSYETPGRYSLTDCTCHDCLVMSHHKHTEADLYDHHSYNKVERLLEERAYRRRNR